MFYFVFEGSRLLVLDFLEGMYVKFMTPRQERGPSALRYDLDSEIYPGAKMCDQPQAHIVKRRPFSPGNLYINLAARLESFCPGMGAKDVGSVVFVQAGKAPIVHRCTSQSQGFTHTHKYCYLPLYTLQHHHIRFP